MKKANRIFLVVAGALAILLVLYAINVFPIPGTDSFVFLPASVNMAHGRGFTNTLYYIAYYVDPTHTCRLNYYVPLFPLVLAWVGKIYPDIRAMFLFCALVSTVGLVSYGKFISQYATRQKWGIALGVLSLIYISTYLLPTAGRPENFAKLIAWGIFLVVFNRIRITAKVYYASLALLFAMLLATQIIGFFLCFGCYLLFESFNEKNLGKLIRTNALLFVGIIILFLGILALSPVGVVDTLVGIRRHIDYVLTRSDNTLASLAFFWFVAPLNFAFAGIFLVAAYFFVGDVRSKFLHVHGVGRLVSALILLAFLGGVLKYVFYGGPTVYNATEFILPLSAYIFARLTASPQKVQLRRIFSVTLILGTLLFCRTVLLFGHTLYTGKDYGSALRALKPYDDQQTIRPTNGLWSLFSEPAKLELFDVTKYKVGDTVILQQAYLPFPLPEGHYRILKDWRAPEPVKIAGIKISERAYGYGFVVCVIQ